MQSSARSSPVELGGVRHRVPERERPLEVRERLGEAEDGLRLACRLDRRDQRVGAATRRRPVRRELRRRRGPAARELVGQPRVQLLALAGQDRRVDRLRQERVAESEAAGRLHGDEDAVLDRQAQRLPDGGLGERRQSQEQRVPDVAAGRRREPQQALGRAVEPGDPLEQQVTQATRELVALAVGRGQELLREEGVAFGAVDDRIAQRRGCRGVGVRREQRRQLLGRERSQVEQERRARAPDSVGKAAHALGRRELVRAVGREQENRPVGEVVREKDHEVERRRVGPVQVLEHEQHRRLGRVIREHGQCLLEHAQLGARRPPVDRSELCERAQGFHERLVRQVRADEVDRAPEPDVEPCVAGACRELGCEPGLADARFSGDEDGRASSRPCLVERAPELLELLYASDERRARARLHPASIAPLHPPGKRS